MKTSKDDTNHPIIVGILLYNEVEVLDFAGPFEVFAIAEIDGQKSKGFKVFTFSQKDKIIIARNGLKIIPDKQISDIKEVDVLIIPGGHGAEKVEIHNTELLDWIRNISSSVKIIASVCTGAFLLAKAGLLKNLKATTHWMDIDEFEKEFPETIVKRDVHFVDNGHIITAAGISAGIEMSLYIVSRMYGQDIALKTAKRMEYKIQSNFNAQSF